MYEKERDLIEAHRRGGMSRRELMRRLGAVGMTAATASVLMNSSATRALAAADLDRDGDLDLVETNVLEPARVLRNDAPRAGHWLVLAVASSGWLAAKHRYLSRLRRGALWLGCKLPAAR